MVNAVPLQERTNDPARGYQRQGWHGEDDDHRCACRVCSPELLYLRTAMWTPRIWLSSLIRKLIRTEPFMGMKSAVINPDICTGCGECESHCRFNAIFPEGDAYRVSPLHCEGCAVCVHVCPVQAVSMQPRQTGEVMYSQTEQGHLVHARLVPGAGNSGLLVHAVKKMALETGSGL